MARTLSVVIPVRDQARTLSRLLKTLSSLVEPEGWQIELVAGYTESRDDTREVLERHQVRIVDSDRIGPSAARNSAARAASGEWLYFIDADACPADTNFFQRLVSAVEDLGETVTFGGPIRLWSGQKYNPVAFADHMACWPHWDTRRSEGKSWLFQPTVSLAISKQLFNELGGFNESIRVLEDYELQERLWRTESGQVHYLHDLVVEHTARGSPLRSLRHSWYWGLPHRDAFFARARHPYRFILMPGVRWIELPRLILNRTRAAFAAGWHVSPPMAVISAPFMLATVAVFCLGVFLGRGQPPEHRPAPV